MALKVWIMALALVCFSGVFAEAEVSEGPSSEDIKSYVHHLNYFFPDLQLEAERTPAVQTWQQLETLEDRLLGSSVTPLEEPLDKLTCNKPECGGGCRVCNHEEPMIQPW